MEVGTLGKRGSSAHPQREWLQERVRFGPQDIQMLFCFYQRRASRQKGSPLLEWCLSESIARTEGLTSCHHGAQPFCSIVGVTAKCWARIYNLVQPGTCSTTWTLGLAALSLPNICPCQWAIDLGPESNIYFSLSPGLMSKGQETSEQRKVFLSETQFCDSHPGKSPDSEISGFLILYGDKTWGYWDIWARGPTDNPVTSRAREAGGHLYLGHWKTQTYKYKRWSCHPDHNKIPGQLGSRKGGPCLLITAGKEIFT